MSKVFKKKLHYWTVSEKRNVLKLTKQNLSPKQIRLQLFKGDKTVNDRSMSSMMSRIKKNPGFVNESPKYPGGKVPIARSLSERKRLRKTTAVKKTVRKKHIAWDQAHKEIVIQNLDLKPFELKKKFFSSERSITVKRLAKLLQNTRRAVRENRLSLPLIKTPVVKTLKNIQSKIDFAGKANELIQKFKLKTDVFKDEFNTLCELVKDSNFSEKTKQKLVVAITEISEQEFQHEQNELSKALKV